MKIRTDMNTVEQFRALLKAARPATLKWKVLKSGEVRHRQTGQCPLEALAGIKAGELLNEWTIPFGLSKKTYEAICKAGDRPYRRRTERELRTLMLVHCKK